MKTKFFLFLALVFTGLMSTSCKKDKDVTPDPVPVEHFFTCKMDGETYHAEGFYAYAVDFDESINIYGATENLEDAIYIELPKGFTTGTHAFNDEFFAYVVFGESAQATLLEGGSGSITVDSFDGKNIKGSFSFTAVDFDDENHKVVVTEGTFDVDIR